MIVLPVRNIGFHIIEKLIDQLQLQFFLVSLIVGEQLPETVEKMAKLGIMGIPFPVEYGGAGGDNAFLPS